MSPVLTCQASEVHGDIWPPVIWQRFPLAKPQQKASSCRCFKEKKTTKQTCKHKKIRFICLKLKTVQLAWACYAKTGPRLKNSWVYSYSLMCDEESVSSSIVIPLQAAPIHPFYLPWVPGEWHSGQQSHEEEEKQQEGGMLCSSPATEGRDQSSESYKEGSNWTQTVKGHRFLGLKNIITE